MRHVVIAIACATGIAALTVGFVGCESPTPDPELPGASFLGAGCEPGAPAGFPYQPGCCSHTVDIPEVQGSGFDDGVVTGAPDHVHVSFVGPTDSSFAVNWRAPLDTTATQLLYGTDEALVAAAEGPSDAVSLVTGHHMVYGSLIGSTGETRVHEVHVCGLSEGTAYYYKVGGPGGWSGVHEVATGPAVGSSDAVRFAVTGDSRDEPTIFADIQAAIYAEGIDFQLFTGDAVNIGANQDEWNALFEATSGADGFAVETALGAIPFMPINGNHDNLVVNYVAQFALPQELSEGEAAQGEEWWSFDYGNVHVIGLNDTPKSSALGDDQLSWLKSNLAAVDRDVTPWIFVTHHRSTYSCGGSHGSDLDLRKAWQPIFDEYQVDIVFSGHDHLYERTKPMRGLNGSEGKVAAMAADGAAINASGTMFVVSGGAGAPLYGADGRCDHTFITESVRNYVIVEIQGRDLTLTAYRDNGSILDELVYSK
jgi:acid phosphatase type 7